MGLGGYKGGPSPEGVVEIGYAIARTGPWAAGAQVTQDAGQFLRGDVEQDGVGEDAVEAGGGQVQPQEVLVPDLAAAGGAGHGDEAGGAVQADGAAVTTIEGLAPSDGGLHPLQTGFWEKHGLQCGYCTPGMIMSVKALLADQPDATADAVRAWLRGNICRCTGYVSILNAVRSAQRRLREAR